MAGISFIHCGDLHLGCQQFNEPLRWEDFRESFSYIIDYAIDKKVDFLLISGDLFHQRNINALTLAMAIGLLERLRNAGIEVLAIEGNHDKAFYLDEDSWMDFLNKQGYLKLLKPGFDGGRLQIGPYAGRTGCLIERSGIRFIGLGYLGATTKQRLEEAAEQILPDDRFTVVLLHAAVDKLMGQDMAGVGRDVFDAFSGTVDYFALGHIHSRQEQKGFIFNPGAPESVHIDEVRKNREKGFYHVIVKGKDKDVTYIPSRRRHICYYDVDITGIPVPAQVGDRTADIVGASDIGEYDLPLVQVNLFGTVDFNSYAIDTGMIADMLKQRFECLAVEVLNNANLVQADDRHEGPGFDRSAVERHVISRMIGEEKPEFGEMINDIADLVIRIKGYSLSGVGEDEIIAAIGDIIDKLPADEAAAAEEVEPDENKEC